MDDELLKEAELFCKTLRYSEKIDKLEKRKENNTYLLVVILRHKAMIGEYDLKVLLK
jgi:hypothetical protein